MAGYGRRTLNKNYLHIFTNVAGRRQTSFSDNSGICIAIVMIMFWGLVAKV